MFVVNRRLILAYLADSVADIDTDHASIVMAARNQDIVITLHKTFVLYVAQSVMITDLLDVIIVQMFHK